MRNEINMEAVAKRGKQWYCAMEIVKSACEDNRILCSTNSKESGKALWGVIAEVCKFLGVNPKIVSSRISIRWTK